MDSNEACMPISADIVDMDEGGDPQSNDALFREMAIHPPDFADVAAFVEESGYSDPFGDGCPNNFDIVSFINDSGNDFSTPVDSPSDPQRFLAQLQQQSGGHHTLPPQQLMVQNLLNGAAQPTLHQQYAAAAGNGQTHLPDSPPTTDVICVSAGDSSISPSSGSYSPFSSPNGKQYVQQLAAGLRNGRQMTQAEFLRLQQQHFQAQQRAGVIAQEQSSPQSEFLSPYPPSQSTPGSQHSSQSQVSPPGTIGSQHRNSSGYAASYSQQNLLMQSQQSGNSFDPSGLIQGWAGQNGGRNSSSSSSGNSSELDLRDIGLAAQQRNMKRRRIHSSQDCIAANENAYVQLINNRTHSGTQQRQQQAEMMPNVKMEAGDFGGARGSGSGSDSSSGGGSGRVFGREQNGRQNSGGGPNRPPQPPSQQSFDDYDEQGNQKTIKFFPFFPEAWSPLYDLNTQEVPLLSMAVVADKGFNYSAQDASFVNQKKNHFQITVNITQMGNEMPYYVRLPNSSGELQPVQEFHLTFCGAKSEMPTSEIPIKQSQTDRKPVPHEAVRFQLDPHQTKQTIPRLHFSETTMNNHRKNGKPNPEQKYFLLVVKLLAQTPIGPILVQAYQSDRVIVRASNPGQFDQPDSELGWQKTNGQVLHYSGQVAIGTEKPIQDAQLTVMGNLVATGQITRPSDRRVKEDIAEIDTRYALNRVNALRIVEYAYKPEIAEQWGLTDENRRRVGVIAQELAQVLPDAVRDNGDFLTVDETRVFYDTVAATQELYRLNGTLDCKMGTVEKVLPKLARFAQKQKAAMAGSMASGISGISDFSNLFGTAHTSNGPSSASKSAGETANKGLLSSAYSRQSLTSAHSFDDYFGRRKGSGGHRRRCASSASAVAGYHSGCRSRHGGELLCSSKVTQGTIVTLVAIMALCLMAMCTLYVLDWYNRTYGNFHGHHYGPGIYPPLPNRADGSQPEPGLMIRLINWNPPKDPSKSPPLAAMCAAGKQSCATYCCDSPSAYSAVGKKQEVDSVISLSTNALDNDATLAPGVASVPQSLLTRLESGVQFKVENLGATIDSRYCSEENGKSTCDWRRGLYNLYVPISPYLPTIPLVLKIEAEAGQFVDNCGILEAFNHRQCELAAAEQDTDDYTDKERSSGKAAARAESHKPSLKSELKYAANPQPFSTKVGRNTFELSVGGFLQSAFRFRIGSTTESCSMPEDQQGRSFDEYNIVFYRQCPQPTPAPPLHQSSTHRPIVNTTGFAPAA